MTNKPADNAPVWAPLRPTLGRAFGRALREARHQQQLSQERLALAVGCDRTYPSLLERGVRTPTLGLVFALAHTLDRPAVQLVQRTEEHLRALVSGREQLLAPADTVALEPGWLAQLEVRAALAGLTLPAFLSTLARQLGTFAALGEPALSARLSSARAAAGESSTGRGPHPGPRP